MDISKLIGSILLVVGTTVGAGMLALPMVSASGGFLHASLLMLVLWFVSVVTGLLVIEVNLALPAQHSTFSSMAEKTMGVPGKILTWSFMLYFLYAMIVAYIIGEADILANYYYAIFGCHLPRLWVSILFTVVFGAAVFWSTAAADYVNRGLMVAKGLLLIIALVLLMPYVNAKELIVCNPNQLKCIWIAVPSFLCSFSYQFIVPSLRMYVGDDPKQLRTIVVVGTTVSMLIYMWWLASILGIVPLEGEQSITSLAQTEGASVGMFTQMIIAIVSNVWVGRAVNGFTIVAMTTAFIGVSLGLFDFLMDGLKQSNNRTGRLETAVLTFVPPLAIAVLFPDGFIAAMSYIAVPVAVLCLILPVLMVYGLRRNSTLVSPYRVKYTNTWVLGLLVLFGLAALVVSVLCVFNYLPGIKIG